MFSSAALIVIEFYRVFLSSIFGGQCRYLPTCSEYSQEAIKHHGFLFGSYLGFRRICKCHPLGKGGIDLVPPAVGAK